MQKPTVEGLVTYFEAMANGLDPEPDQPCVCDDTNERCHAKGMAFSLRRAINLLKDALNTGDSGA